MTPSPIAVTLACFGAACAVAATASAQRHEPAVSLSVQAGHANRITAIAASDDGRYIVTGSDDLTSVLWDAESGREIRSHTGHHTPVVGIALLPGLRVLSAESGGSMQIWDARSGEQLAGDTTALPAPREPTQFSDWSSGFSAIAVDPTGRYVAQASTGLVDLYDAQSLREIKFVDRAYRSGDPVRIVAIGFLPGGSRLLSADSAEKAEIRLWDVERRVVLRRFRGHHGGVTGLAVDPQGRFFVTAGDDSTALLWSPDSAHPLVRMRHSAPVRGVAVSRDGRYILTATTDNVVELWDAATGTAVRKFNSEGYEITAIAFAGPTSAIAATSIGAILEWSVDRGELTGFIRGRVRVPNAIAVSATELLVASSDTVWRWDLQRGALVSPLIGHTQWINTVAVTRDGHYAATGSFDSTLRVWDLVQAQGIASAPLGSNVETVAWDTSGRIVAAGTSSGKVLAQRFSSDASRLEPIGRPCSIGHMVRSVALSPDGRQIVATTIDGVTICEVRTGKTRRHFMNAGNMAFDFTQSAVFSPKGWYVLGASTLRGDIQLWDAKTQSFLRWYPGHPRGTNVVLFDAVGDHFFSAGDDKVIRRWSIDDSKRPERTYEGAGSAIQGLELSPDGQFLFAASLDGTVRIWRTDATAPIATLVVLRGKEGEPSGWAVVAPDGRFDTNSFEQVEALHWRSDDDPLAPLPLEVFMRDFYQPRLLPALLAGTALPPVPSLGGVNRVQPVAEITGATLSASGRTEARVTVVAHSRARETRFAGRDTTLRSGVYDLRLFRDGQLVGQWPRVDVEPDEHERAEWRRLHALPLDANGDASHTFTIQLGRRASTDTVVFSAYAFNGDRVKSVTVSESYTVKGTALPARRAYVVAVGVGYNPDPTLVLTSASYDAVAVMDSLSAALRATGAFDSVMPIPVVSRSRDPVIEYRRLPNVVVAPTKANIRSILDILAGEPITAEQRSALASDGAAALINQLQRARPQDLVILTFTMHGIIDPARGEFVLLPVDAHEPAAERGAGSQYPRGIAASELSQWLRDVDAGTLVMVLSTCFSQSSVGGAGFRPGPMGDGGFGQLAYDKGMQILAAAQEAARGMGMTYLNRALIVDGPRALRSHGDVTLTDLFRFAERWVPQSDARAIAASARSDQQPLLFDFRRRRSDVLIYRR